MSSKTRQSNLNWPELTFYAAALQEKFAHASFITLKEHYYDVCSQRAFHQIYNKPTDLANPQFYQAVRNRTKYVIEQQHVQVYEYIQTLPTQIVVCLDYDTMSDKSIFDALDRMSNIDDSLLNANTTITLSGPKSFSLNHLNIEDNNE